MLIYTLQCIVSNRSTSKQLCYCLYIIIMLSFLVTHLPISEYPWALAQFAAIVNILAR